MRNHENTLKKYQHDETKLPPTIRHILRELNSRQFLLFLETLTGIDNLLSDPYFIGGGAHIAARGDFLNIHADFNWHHKLQAHHGHPHPLTCPQDVYRKALNLYYYTTRRDEAEIYEPHFTVYKTQGSTFATELAENYRKSADSTK